MIAPGTSRCVSGFAAAGYRFEFIVVGKSIKHSGKSSSSAQSRRAVHVVISGVSLMVHS